MKYKRSKIYNFFYVCKNKKEVFLRLVILRNFVPKNLSRWRIEWALAPRPVRKDSSETPRNDKGLAFLKTKKIWAVPDYLCHSPLKFSTLHQDIRFRFKSNGLSLFVIRQSDFQKITDFCHYKELFIFCHCGIAYRLTAANG